MNNPIDSRRSPRIGHKSIITLQDDFGYPYYAMIFNVNEAGFYFQTLYELQPGKHIHFEIEDLPSGFSQNSCRAKVVWCRKLNDHSAFCYEIGTQYCRMDDSDQIG